MLENGASGRISLRERHLWASRADGNGDVQERQSEVWAECEQLQPHLASEQKGNAWDRDRGDRAGPAPGSPGELHCLSTSALELEKGTRSS